MTEIERAADALHHIDAGCARDEWVRAGMAAKSAGLDFDDFHNWSASGGNYAGENECRTVWKSFAESGAVTPATLFGMAFAQGWKDPSKSRTKGVNGTRPSLPLTRTKQTPQTPIKQAASLSPDEVWERCMPARPAEPYIYRKQGKPDGVRVYPASAPELIIHDKNMQPHNVTGWLVVPCWCDNELQTLQFIPPEKGIQKLNLPKGKFSDGFHTVGEMTDRVYICEGIGQAWACNTASGAAAVCCFGSGRMATVTKALRDKFPSLRLIIVSDKGMEDKAAKIAADVAGQWIAMPADKPGNYDANDYLQEHGTGALADLLQRPVAPAMPHSNEPEEPPFQRVSLADVLTNPPPPQAYIWGERIPTNALTLLAAHGGTGKSLLALQLAAHVAVGRPFLGLPTIGGIE